jgi:hypothetical protein
VDVQEDGRFVIGHYDYLVVLSRAA